MSKENHDEVFCTSMCNHLSSKIPDVCFYIMNTPIIMFENKPQTSYEKASANYTAFFNGMVNDIEASKRKIVLIYEMYEENDVFKFRGRVI